MKDRNSVIALVVGILSGCLAFYLLYQKTSEIEQKATPTQVLVAAHYIPPGTFLNPEMAEKKVFPESYISPSAIRDLKEVDGLMSLVPISAGEQILSNKFGLGEQTLALSLNPGYRAYTLEVNETTGVGNLVRPGNHVDILAKLNSEKRQVTSFVFQDLQVLAVGQKLGYVGMPKKNNGESNSGGNDNSGSYSTVTLAVTPEEAETLMFFEGQSLKLVLRAPNDNEISVVPAQSESEIMAKLGHFTQKASHDIQIIRGNQKRGE
jgi:pilus assembly protein CpaB